MSRFLVLLLSVVFAMRAEARPELDTSHCELREVVRPVAMVTWTKGLWRFAITPQWHPLCGGQPLPAGARLMAVSEHASLHIAYAEERGVTYSRSGSLLEDPTALLIDPSSGQALSYSERIARAAELLGTLRPIFLPPTGRSGRIKLRDAVLTKRADGLVDLAKVFSEAVPDDYELLLQEWVDPPNGPGWRRIRFFDYRWRPGDPTAIEIPGLGVGLYRIQRLDRSVATLDDAWIFVSPPGTYTVSRKAFEEFEEQMPWWGGQSESAETRGLLRAYLHLLAQESVDEASRH